MAAFKATQNTKSEESTPKPRVPLRIDTGFRSKSTTELPKAPKKQGTTQRAISNQHVPLVQIQQSKNSPADKPKTPLVTNALSGPRTPGTPKTPRTPLTNSPRYMRGTSTNSLLTSAGGSDLSNKDYFGQPLVGVSRSEQTNGSDPQDMIKNIKQSIGSKYISNDHMSANNANSKRLSIGTQPKEMLDSVRNSISSKAKNNSQSNEMSERNQQALNGIRHSIDLKRISTHHENSIIALPSYEERNKIIDMIAKNNNPEEQRLLYGKRIYSYSSSSIGSYLDDEYDRLPTPIIVFDNTNTNTLHDEDASEREGEYNDYDDNEVSDPRIDDRAVSPIEVPLSLNACARLGIDSTETKPKNLKIPTPGKEELIKSKPKRKPPPELESDYFSSSFTDPSGDEYYTENEGEEAFSDTPSINKGRRASSNINFVEYDNFSEVSSKVPIKLSEDSEYYYFYESDFSGSETPSVEKVGDKYFDDDKLPQFPLINNNSRKIFRKKKPKPTNPPQEIENKLTQPSELNSSAEKVNEYDSSSRSSTPVITHQNKPVQLKTTMRTKTRKEKKNIFNENKPWKNHSELNYITSEERKRYEGLWASNRGLYINSAVTRLIGIDYDNISTTELDHTKDVPAAAAKSSSTSSSLDPTNMDHENFHGLVSTETTQLIHGVVVKRIWKRSRLPRETLENIWNLVDFRKDGTLNKPQFIVGMWLVDQCLYGRKLPKKIDSEVWNSLGNVGLNVVLKKKNKR